MKMTWKLGPFLLVSSAAFAQKTQIPPGIAAETAGIADRFAAVLEEECPNNICSAVGCETTRFLTLDERQGSSLPGLDFEDAPPKSVQYKLASVRCEFTYEPGMDAKQLASLRQRLLQKVKATGVALQLTSRMLNPKPDVVNATKPPELLPQQPAPPPPPPPTVNEQIAASLIPVLPWLACALVGMLVLLGLIWGLRRLGKTRPKDEMAPRVALPTEVDSTSLAVKAEAPEANASPYMLMTKTEQLRGALAESPLLTEQVLRPLLESDQYDELCLFLRHFGPEPLASLKKKPQLASKLSRLSEAYTQEVSLEAGPKKTTISDSWNFLERVERRLVGAKVRLTDETALEDEFAFMANLTVDEAKGLLAELSTTEAVVAIANMPRLLRDDFFAASDASFLSAFVEQLATVDKVPDPVVRGTARKMREIHESSHGDLRTVPLRRVPLLEQALNALGPDERKELWQGIAKSRPELAQAVSPRIFLDASLAHLPDALLTEAFLALNPKAAAAYLEQHEARKEILGRLKPRLAESIGRYLNAAHPDRALANEARTQVSAFVKEKDAQGLIDLGAINAKVIK